MSNKQYLTKITNEDLKRLIVCAINTKYSTRLPAAYERSWLEALQNEKLEIEGYERTGWTKIDPNNPKTFPACNSEWFLIAAQKYLKPPTFTVIPECATEALLEEIRHDIIKFKLNVYWRPFPQPPGEETSNETK